MLALREAMNWPTWSTIWLPAYPLLQNITWGPSATIDHSAINNVAVGRGILGFGEQPKQFWKYEYYKKSRLGWIVDGGVCDAWQLERL